MDLKGIFRTKIGPDLLEPVSVQRNISITGGAGFIGSHVVRRFVTKYPQYRIINLDVLTYAGNLENLRDVEKARNYTFVKADIRDMDAVRKVFEEPRDRWRDGYISLRKATWTAASATPWPSLERACNRHGHHAQCSSGSMERCFRRQALLPREHG